MILDLQRKFGGSESVPYGVERNLLLDDPSRSIQIAVPLGSALKIFAGRQAEMSMMETSRWERFAPEKTNGRRLRSIHTASVSDPNHAQRPLHMLSEM